jgi:hypothetical protein
MLDLLMKPLLEVNHHVSIFFTKPFVCTVFYVSRNAGGAGRGRPQRRDARRKLIWRALCLPTNNCMLLAYISRTW